nr:uncharacterized protein LOC107454893 isoform X2 [Parasteatoda tepidariorum]
MTSKQTGYDFWNNVLGCPKYVAAPMVDMSELAYRLLCRRHGAELCYSPMLHSQQFAQDFLYRQDNFSTSSVDRPLIIQFCANDPDTFIEAASLVVDNCDAIDLNLGCPQAIARKGYYGAFLQDDWELIHSIIRKAANNLPIPITAKMRILPGPFQKSVEYANIHQDEKITQILTDASTIKDFYAVCDVLKELPKLKSLERESNTDEDISDIDELFQSFELQEDHSTRTKSCIVDTYSTSPQTTFINNNINTLTTDICNNIHAFVQRSNEPETEKDKSHASNNIHSSVQADNESETEKDTSPVCNNIHSSVQTDNESETEKDKSHVCNNIHSSVQTDNESEIVKDKSHVCESYDDHLPVWLCHSRPRVGDNEKSRGCFSGYFSTSEKNIEEQYMSKKKTRRARHHERVLASMKEKRKVKKMRRKLKIAEMKKNQPINTEEVVVKEKLTKKQQKMMIRERLLKAQGTAPKVCINLGFATKMVEKELGQLASQLRRLYGSNRHSFTPLHLYFCNLETSDKLYQICLAKNDGFSSYVVDITPEEPENLFEQKDLIYLSPDSENVLETLDKNKIYVIGGIVDGTVKKDLSLNHAKDYNIHTVRLPITEYLVPCSTNPGTTVLTVNQVFDILLKYYETENWIEALSSNVPIRKGFCAPPLSGKSSDLIQTESENVQTHLKQLVDHIS